MEWAHIVRSDQPSQIIEKLEFYTQAELDAFVKGWELRYKYRVPPAGANGVFLVTERN